MAIERRFHPRFDVDFLVKISFVDNDISLTGQAVNFSLSGIQLRVNKAIVDEILQHTLHPPQFIIAIETAGCKIPNLAVRLIVNRRVSQQHFQLGLKFINVAPEQLSNLQRLIGLTQK